MNVTQPPSHRDNSANGANDEANPENDKRRCGSGRRAEKPKDSFERQRVTREDPPC